MKNIAINVFILEIECLDLFHHWWKEKMSVISIDSYYNVNMTSDFPQYLHGSTSSKGKLYRLGAYLRGPQLRIPVLRSVITSPCYPNNTWFTEVLIILLLLKSTQSISLNHFLFLYLQDWVIGAWLELWKVSQKCS